MGSEVFEGTNRDFGHGPRAAAARLRGAGGLTGTAGAVIGLGRGGNHSMIERTSYYARNNSAITQFSKYY